MAPEWEAKEPRDSWAEPHVLGFQCVLRGGLSKGPGGRAVSVTVIFMVKMHDGKYKKCKSEMQTSAFCMCFQMISLTAQHCLGVQKVLTQGSVHRWPFAMLPPPPPPEWAGTVGPAPSGTTAAVLSRTTEWDAPPYTTQCTIFIITLRDFIYFLNFIWGQGLTMQPTRTHNHLASASQGLRLQARTTMAGFFFNVGPRAWTRVLMLKKQALSTYGDISQVSLWDS